MFHWALQAAILDQAAFLAGTDVNSNPSLSFHAVAIAGVGLVSALVLVWAAWRRDRRGQRRHLEQRDRQIALLQQGLAEAQVRLRGVLDAVAEGVLLADAEDRVAWCSEKAQATWGADCGQIAGKAILELHSPESRPKAAEILAEVRRSPSASVTAELACPRGRGLNHYAGLHDPEGRYLGLIVVSRDMSQRQELEKEQKRLRDHMFQQEKMILIGQIAAGVAHELNTPLGTILLRSQLVLRQFKGQEELADLKMIESEAQRCRRIIDSLLSFSRRSEGAMAETSVAALIEESLPLVEKDLELRGITIEAGHSLEAATVCVDPNQIQQVLLNLITNAADAMAGGGRITIATRPMADRGMLEIRVTDTGCGMTPEVLAKACTPFFTTKERRKGTGLGLAICRRIVEDHQGELAIDSRPGEGTTVTIRLPQVPAKVRTDG